jgi:NADH-quinone oxidoreductase subunit G
VSRDWDAVLPALRQMLSEVAQRAPQRLAAVLSPWMTVEEAYLLAGFLKGLSPQVTLALGPVRTVGEDDTYPKDVRGRPLQPVRFTIRAEKCPNRRGVEIVLRHFAGDVVPFGDVLGRTAAGDFDAVYLVGGDPHGWITDAQASALQKPAVVVVQDILPSPALVHATFVLPGGSFAERDGTFVNHAGLAQEVRRSIRGPGHARPDGRILWELTGRKGLFQAAALRKEMAEQVPTLSALGAGLLGERGVFVDRDGTP